MFHYFYSPGELNNLKKLIKRFEKLQQKFGWGIDAVFFRNLFQLSEDQSLELFQLWDTDHNRKSISSSSILKKTIIQYVFFI